MARLGVVQVGQNTYIQFDGDVVEEVRKRNLGMQCSGSRKCRQPEEVRYRVCSRDSKRAAVLMVSERAFSGAKAGLRKNGSSNTASQQRTRLCAQRALCI
jgi:hypothetical protein